MKDYVSLSASPSKAKRTFILSTSQISYLRQCDRIIALEAGELKFDGLFDGYRLFANVFGKDVEGSGLITPLASSDNEGGFGDAVKEASGGDVKNEGDTDNTASVDVV